MKTVYCKSYLEERCVDEVCDIKIRLLLFLSYI